MITIASPIELKTAGFSLSSTGFEERIRGNYDLMGSDITGETLTHMLHTPPEILVAEGGSSTTNIGGAVYSFSERQQTIINNAINRILISADMPLNYQDRVYITSVLNKLGIKDEQRFMNEAYSILKETRNTLELTRLYLDNATEISNLITLAKGENPPLREQRSEEAGETTFENRLYMNIMNRLKTGLVYQIVENMNVSTAPGQVSPGEVVNSEQYYTSRQLLLQRLRETIVGTELPMIYRAENVYEEETREAIPVTETKLKERINSAALLEVIRSFDHASALRYESEQKFWTDYRESFYRTADNVLTKILIGAREHRSVLNYKESPLSFINRSETNEIRALTGIIMQKDRAQEYISETIREYNENIAVFGSEYSERFLQELREREERETFGFKSELFSREDLEYVDKSETETFEEWHERLEAFYRDSFERYGVTRDYYVDELERAFEFKRESEVHDLLRETDLTFLERTDTESFDEWSERIESYYRDNVESLDVTREEFSRELERVEESSRESAVREYFRKTDLSMLERRESESLEAWQERVESFYEENLESLKVTREEFSRALERTFERQAETFARETESRSELQSLYKKESESVETWRERIEKYYTDRVERTGETRREFFNELQRTGIVSKESQFRESFRESSFSFLERRENETLEEELERINSRNVENIEKYKEIKNILLSSLKSTSIRSDRERTIRESLKSLSDKEHLIKLLESEETKETSTVDSRLEKIYKLLPPETVAIFRQFEEAGKNGGENATAVPSGELAELQINQFLTEKTEENATEFTPGEIEYREPEPDISVDESRIRQEILTEVLNSTGIFDTVSAYETLIDREMRQEERAIVENERLSRIEQNRLETVFLENLLSEAGVSQTEARTVARDRGEFRRLVNMVYKVNETLSEDDIMERLEEFRRTQATEKVSVTETPEVFREVSKVTEVHESSVSQFQLDRQRQQEISAMVESGIRRQLGMISNEVYSRLEKRLKNEKARRGF